MSTFIKEYPSTLLRFDAVFAYVTLTDFSPGHGLLQIHSDYGSYSYFWGAMGENRKIIQFLASCNSSYIHTKLQSCINYQSMKKEAQRRLQEFMINCWPDIHTKIKELAQ